MLARRKHQTNHKKLTRGERGFTLIELMAAMTGGLFMTVAIYAFTRDMTEFFQREMRLSDATINAVAGFERLRGDISRAGFLSSPNLARDQNRCPRPASGGAALPPVQMGALSSFPGLEEMGLARIIQGATAGTFGGANHMIDNNAGGLSPDQIVLYGNYTTAEHFPVKNVNVAAGQIFLELNSAAMARLGIPATPADAAADLARLVAVFQPGRILRIVDETGREQYGIIRDPSVDFVTDPTGDPTVWLNPLVGLIAKDGAAGGTCGLRAHAAGAVVNPVDIVRYELNTLTTNPSYDRLFDADLAASTTDNTRLDLVRVQVDPDGTDIPGTTELVAEYAVDLKFGLTVNTNVLTGVNTYLGEDHASLMNFAGVPFEADSGQAGTFGPHLIRGIHARLAVRTREAEYTTPLLQGAALTAATSEDLYRVAVAANTFARVRSLRAHIATRNSRTENWN